MENLINAIRAATAENATPEARAAGSQACRTILAALDAKQDEPLAIPQVPATPLQAILGALRGMPPDQLLDLAIAKLKAALPAGTEAPAVQAVRIPLAPVARLGGGPRVRR